MYVCVYVCMCACLHSCKSTKLISFSMLLDFLLEKVVSLFLIYSTGSLTQPLIFFQAPAGFSFFLAEGDSSILCMSGDSHTHTHIYTHTPLETKVHTQHTQTYTHCTIDIREIHVCMCVHISWSPVVCVCTHHSDPESVDFQLSWSLQQSADLSMLTISRCNATACCLGAATCTYEHSFSARCS